MEETLIRKSIENIRFLIADTGSSRKSIQRLLSHFEVKRAMIEVVGTMEEARAAIAKSRPQVVFAEFEISGKAGLDLIQLHRDSLERGTPRAFILIINRNSNMLVSNAADDPVDALLVRPFTFQGLQKQLIELVEQKLAPSDYFQMINEGARLLQENNLEPARGLFEQARNLNPEASQAYSFLGIIHHREGHNPEAIHCFNRALELDPESFKGLMGLFDVYLTMGNSRGAYEAAKWIAHYHPLPLKRLPDFIRVSIANNRLHEILGFYEVSADVDQLPSEIANSVAAGLTVCGLQFIQRGDRENAVGAFKRAVLISRGNPLVLKRVLCALIEAGFLEEYSAFAAKAASEVLGSLEVRVAEVKYWDGQGEFYRVLKMGLEAIHLGLHDRELFRLMIQRSVELKRNAGTIRELVDLASRHYPEMAEAYRQQVSADAFFKDTKSTD